MKYLLMILALILVVNSSVFAESYRFPQMDAEREEKEVLISQLPGSGLEFVGGRLWYNEEVGIHYFSNKDQSIWLKWDGKKWVPSEPPIPIKIR